MLPMPSTLAALHVIALDLVYVGPKSMVLRWTVS
jgi:hypothetical protein